ncbi:hypothetical protein ACVIGB_001140 [Bradyrhizobium sp. USDA 4341]
MFELCFLLLMTFFLPLAVTGLVFFAWVRGHYRASGSAGSGYLLRRLRHLKVLSSARAGIAGKVTSVAEGLNQDPC